MVSFDETIANMNSIEANYGKTDRFLREGPGDNGECIVTKSSSSMTSVCGRLGNVIAPPVNTFFDSGESFHLTCAPHIESDIRENDENLLS